ncbi:MAG: GNAT family N-acetyltransferase [Bacteroidetes bacterium]|nr:GNAT family N-acetyltransferase [Bacteroidota bacterium]
MAEIESFEFTDRKGRKILIRNASPDDAAKIIEMKTGIVMELDFMLKEPDEIDYTQADEKERISDSLNHAHDLYIVAESGAEIIGQLNFDTGSLKRTKHCGMFTVRVTKEFRNSGTGKILINTLLDHAEKDPAVEKVALNAFSTNKRALKLYEDCGFTREGYCPKDMKLSDGTYIDSVLMYKFVK